jgi:hypothetical protein
MAPSLMAVRGDEVHWGRCQVASASETAKDASMVQVHPPPKDMVLLLPVDALLAHRAG